MPVRNQANEFFKLFLDFIVKKKAFNVTLQKISILYFYVLQDNNKLQLYINRDDY